MAQDIATPYRDPRSAFGNRNLPAGYAGGGRGVLGGATSMDLDTAPGTPSDIARKSAYTMNRPKGSIFDAPNPLSITGQLAGAPDQQVVAGPEYQPPAAPVAARPAAVVPAVAPPTPNIANIANIMPPQPPGNVPLVPTDSATAAPAAVAAAPVAPTPTLDASTQLALSAARTEAAGRVDPGVQGGGLAGIADSATAARNAGMDANRTRYLAEQALAHGGVRGATQYAAIENAGANASGERNVALQTQAATATAAARNGSELNIARMTDATHRYATDQNGLLTARGQDIGATTHAAATKSAMDIANLHAASAEKVANITSEGRIEAQSNKALRPVVVGGGQEPYTDPATGLTTMRLMPQRVVDSQTGQEIGQAAPKPATIGTDPKALAIKANTSLSIDEKRAQLKALGY